MFCSIRHFSEMASLEGLFSRRRNRLTCAQIHDHEAILSEYLAGDNEGEDLHDEDDDNDVDYVPDEREASDIEFELEVEENIELPEDDMDLPEPEAFVEEAVEPTARGRDVCRLLLGESEDHYECKNANILWNKEPPTPRARHWNRFTSTRPIGPAGKFLPNPIGIFKEIITPQMVDIIVRAL